LFGLPAMLKRVRSRFPIWPSWGNFLLRPTPLIWIASRSVVVSSVALTGLFYGLQQFGSLEPLELGAFDRLVQLRSTAPLDSRLLVVGLTETDLHRYRWPLSDEILAQTLQKLQTFQPRVIGLDLYRDLPTPPGEAALATQLHAKNLVAITELVGQIPAPPQVDRDRVGFNDFTLDSDGVLRRNLVFVAAPPTGYYSFALRLSLAYHQQNAVPMRPTDSALWIGDVPLTPLNRWSGGYQQADARGYQIVLNYRHPQAIARTVTLSQVLANEVDPSWVKDKVVLIGTTAPSLKDAFYTPYSAAHNQDFQSPGVNIHAQMTSQLLDLLAGQAATFAVWPQWGELLWLWGWTLVGGMLVWRWQSPVLFGVCGLLGLATIALLGWGLFTQLIWIPIAEPALALVAAMGVAMAHRLLYTTTHDPVTGLYNRATFLRHLQRSLSPALRHPAPHSLSVIFLNLDQFQRINKSLGYQMGDRLLLAVIARWHKILPPKACLARIGGDELALAANTTDQAQLTQLAKQLQTALDEPLELQQQTIQTVVSIGIALSQTDHIHTPENLLRAAHTAMYRAKSLGQSQYAVFAPGMLEEATHQFTLEAELRRGIANQEFVLYYQPLISLATGTIAGFEALIRWQHPQKGLVPPFQFIPLAEETGLIVPLGQWILQAACQQSVQWRSQFPDHPLIISVNLSGRQFEQPNLVAQIAQIFDATGADSTSLKLEITESMVMGDVEAAIDLMLQLKALGCQLGLDDFGTGYSSLSYLRRFPIDTLKVDRSFVAKMVANREDYEIVRMIISLGHTLGMDVIAEGVETPEDAAVLRSLSCEYGQGFLWAKPLPVTEATTLIQTHRSSQRT